MFLNFINLLKILSCENWSKLPNLSSLEMEKWSVVFSYADILLHYKSIVGNVACNFLRIIAKVCKMKWLLFK